MSKGVDPATSHKEYPTGVLSSFEFAITLQLLPTNGFKFFWRFMMCDRHQSLQDRLNIAGEELIRQLREEGYSEQDLQEIRLELTVVRREENSNTSETLPWKPNIELTSDSISSVPLTLHFTNVTRVENQSITVLRKNLNLSLERIFNSDFQSGLIVYGELKIYKSKKPIAQAQRSGCNITPNCTIRTQDHKHDSLGNCLNQRCD